jgi:hypothetical protein
METTEETNGQFNEEDDEIISESELKSLSQWLDGSLGKDEDLDIGGIKKMMDKVFSEEVQFDEDPVMSSEYHTQEIKKPLPTIPTHPSKSTSSKNSIQEVEIAPSKTKTVSELQDRREVRKILYKF